jgi:hypothetical protein
MGCDIHLYAEVRRDGKWHRVFPPPEARDPWYIEQAANVNGGTYYAVRALCTWYHDRNYNVFGMLAGVRAREFRPIAEPRGWPDDLSDEVRAILHAAETAETEDALPEGEIWPGDHSFSWLTLRELLEYDWQCRTSWEDTYAECAGQFYTKVIPALQTLGDPDDVRIVFGFDS